MPFGVPVVSNSCAFYTAHEAAGAHNARHSLRPRRFEGHVDAKLGQIVSRECEGVAAFLVRPILRDAAQMRGPQDDVETSGESVA
jgi:hypothetical protein